MECPKHLEFFIHNCKACPYYWCASQWFGVEGSHQKCEHVEADFIMLNDFQADQVVHAGCPLPNAPNPAPQSIPVEGKVCPTCGCEKIFLTIRDEYPYECQTCRGIFSDIGNKE